MAGIPEVSVIEFDIPDPVVSPWPDDVTPKTKRKGMYIESASPIDGSDNSYVSDDNAVSSGDENIVAPPESFSGRTNYVMSPDLHMPVPLIAPAAANGEVDNEAGMESDMLPTQGKQVCYIYTFMCIVVHYLLLIRYFTNILWMLKESTHLK